MISGNFDVEYPFESKYLQLERSGEVLHYVDEGRGPVMLLVHGNPTWSFLYRHIIKYFRNDYRVIAFDHLGMGLSSKPEGADYSYVAHCSRMAEFVDRLELNDVNLIVQDWGGPIGLHWAGLHKNRVNSLVIMNTSLEGVSLAKSKMEVILSVPAVLFLRIPFFGEYFYKRLDLIRYVLRSGISNKDRKIENIIRNYTSPYVNEDCIRAAPQLAREIPFSFMHRNKQVLSGVRNNLKGWLVPVKLIWGELDPVCVRKYAIGISKLFPCCEKISWIESASHFLQEDEPDIVINRIECFFRSKNIGYQSA